jgi:hypothetical protein
MHEPAPIPPDPESERRGHELRDVAIRPILYFLIGLFIFGGVLQTVMSTIMRGYVASEPKVGVPGLTVEDVRAARTLQRKILDKSLHDDGKSIGDNIRPAPPVPLQRDTTADMLAMYKEEDAVLTSYYKDQKTGQVRIPIDRAMQIVAKKGLPHRDTPADKIDKELPYPARSEPYMAKY